jgi:alkylation response protein AidB-like acyl-CoA dehydrogenase
MLFAHGNDEQIERYLWGLCVQGWTTCQMLSEPDAGSDLAGVRTRAERDGDEWVFNGQKVWTSRGMWARWGLCLARTDPDVPKHAGLTMFAVDMQHPGVDVRPLVQMNGDRHFSEVFVSDARMPDDARIGGVGEGWKVAMTVLAHERAAAGGGGGAGGGERQGRTAPSWLDALAERGSLGGAPWRDRAMRVFTLGEVARLTASRSAAEAASGRPGPGGSGAKLRTVAKYCGEAYLTKDAHGAGGMLDDDEGHVEFLTAPSMSIRGGTDEIQRNILGERVLGLPGEPRVDRDVPWSRSRHGVI